MNYKETKLDVDVFKASDELDQKQKKILLAIAVQKEIFVSRLEIDKIVGPVEDRDLNKLVDRGYICPIRINLGLGPHQIGAAMISDEGIEYILSLF